MRGSSQEGLAPSTTGGQPIEIGGLPLEGPETIFVPVPLSQMHAVELKAYAEMTKQTVQRAAAQLLEIGMRSQSQWTGVAREALQAADERRVD